MAKANNPAGLSHQEILALKAQAGGTEVIETPAVSVPSSSQWANAPDITKREKVSRPVIRDEAGKAVTDTGAKIAAPTLKSMNEGDKRAAQLRLEAMEREEAERAAREATSPDKVQARLST